MKELKKDVDNSIEPIGTCIVKMLSPAGVRVYFSAGHSCMEEYVYITYKIPLFFSNNNNNNNEEEGRRTKNTHAPHVIYKYTYI